MKQNNNNTKQKILMVHNYYQIPGGEDTVVANEKKLLEENGHKVVLYCRNNSELKEISKFKKLILPITTIFNIKTYIEIRKIIKNENVDIVHVHNTLNLISPSVYYAAKSKKIPIVQTIHNFRLLCPGATLYSGGHICEDCIKIGMRCAIKKNCYRNSKLQTLACVLSTKFHRITGIYSDINYICLTEFNRNKLSQLKQIEQNKIFVKPNFVEEDGTFITYRQRKNQFVFVGRLDKLKGIDLLLHTWNELKKNGDAPKLIIMGTGPMEDWCKKYIIDNKLQSVEMIGYISNAKAREIMAISKALILPTLWYEGFPMTIVEAYSVGTPVIGSDIGNVGNLILEGITGYKFECNSIESLKQVINHKSFDICEETKRVYKENYMKNENYVKLNSIYRKVKE